LFRAVLCTAVVYNGMHSYEQFLKLAVGLDLAFCVFFCFSIDHFVLVLLAFVVLGLVSSDYVMRLAEKNVSEMTYFVLSVM